MADGRVPVWLDCDPGHDDAFAILLAAYHPGIRLLGISTVFGNASLEKTTRNALSTLTAIGKARHVPVFAGAHRALHRPALRPPEDIHGRSGLDGTSLLPRPLVQVANGPLHPAILARPALAPSSSDSDSRAPDSEPSQHTSSFAATPPPETYPSSGYSSGTHPNTPTAVDAAAAALRREAPGTAWLVATGPFTNAAAVFLEHPDLVGHVGGLSLMGGAVGGGFTSAVWGHVAGVPRIGNWTPYAELNVLADPEAAAAIFANEQLAAKTTLCALDLTHQALATREVRDQLLYGPEGNKKKKAGRAGQEGGEQEEEEEEEEGRQGKTMLRTMLVDLLMFFAKTYKDVFEISEGCPLHDPLAVAAVLEGAGKGDSIPFDDTNPSSGQRERFKVTVVTEGSYSDAKAGAHTGQTVVEPLALGEEGVSIPRGLDVAKFWKVLEECIERADRANEELPEGDRVW